jgi:hypothetical protein
MGDQAGGLVDDHQVRVLVDDLEMGSRLARRRLARAGIDLDDLAGRDAMVLGPRRAVHQDTARVDQPLGGGARPGRAARRQEGVEPQPGVLGAGL